MAIYKYIEFRKRWDTYWTHIAERLRVRYDRLYGYSYDERGKIRSLLDGLLWRVISDEPYRGGKKIISAKLIRLNYIRLSTRISAVLIAAVLVIAFRLDFVEVLSVILPGDMLFLGILESSPAIRFILTVLAISIGSEPLHKVIAGIEDYADKKRKAPGGQIQ